MPLSNLRIMRAFKPQIPFSGSLILLVRQEPCMFFTLEGLSAWTYRETRSGNCRLSWTWTWKSIPVWPYRLCIIRSSTDQYFTQMLPKFEPLHSPPKSSTTLTDEFPVASEPPGCDDRANEAQQPVSRELPFLSER